MCMNLPENPEADFAKQSAAKIAWKVLEREPDFDNDDFYRRLNLSGLWSPVYRHEWVPGIAHSGKPDTNIPENDRERGVVNRGIHVFTSYEAALYWAKFCGGEAERFFVVKVEVSGEELIAANLAIREAVYRKVTLPKAEYERVMERSWP